MSTSGLQMSLSVSHDSLIYTDSKNIWFLSPFASHYSQKENFPTENELGCKYKSL